MITANTAVTLKHDVIDPRGMVVGGASFLVEGKWVDVADQSWRTSAQQGNPAAVQYYIRAVANSLPMDDNVYYGKINGIGHLVHATEIVTS